MTQKELSYYKQEVAMCAYRIRLHEGRARLGESGNPLSRAEAKHHLARTREFIRENPALYL